MQLSFEQIRNLKNSTDDFSFSSLSDETKKYLQDKILNFNDGSIFSAKEVFKKYFSLNVPSNFIKEILSDNIELAYHVYFDEINNASHRELLIDSLLNKINIKKNWPSINDDEDYTKDFFKQLQNTSSQYGISQYI